MPRLVLVRHGRPAVDTATPAETWLLDPEGLPNIDALAADGRLPTGAVWCSSPEPKALGTAQRLTPGPVTVVAGLAEHVRAARWFADAADFRAAVRRAFERPEQAAVPGWEPLVTTSERLLPAVRRLLAEHPHADLVLVGHGTAWTLLVAELTGSAPDLDAWEALRMPDIWEVDRPVPGEPGHDGSPSTA